MTWYVFPPARVHTQSLGQAAIAVLDDLARCNLSVRQRFLRCYGAR